MCRRMAGSSRQKDRTSVFLEHEQLSSRPDQMCMHALEAASVFLTIAKIEAWINLYIYMYICVGAWLEAQHSKGAWLDAKFPKSAWLEAQRL